ncbi:unnamed protein product [Amoebophrya sp. A120]|nr:unnamed protein product [Amoebophrya sp. A120]|eukprot:GSA120T00016579001.1
MPVSDVPVYTAHPHFSEEEASLSAATVDEICRALSTEAADSPGVVVVKNVFPPGWVRDTLGPWITGYYASHQTDSPKKDHFSSGNKRIWRLPEKLPAEILLRLFDEKSALCRILDQFLGRFHIGSLAVNTVLPNGKPQKMHTDYPPGFYEPVEMQDLFSSHHLEKILPFFSLQVGIAVTAVTKENGGTQFVCGSHRGKGVDHQLAEYSNDSIDASKNSSSTKSPPFLEEAVTTCPELEPGDCLFFNRKLAHRGGGNETAQDRTVVLLQAIMPFGVKMEVVDSDLVIDKLKKHFDEEQRDLAGKSTITAAQEGAVAHVELEKTRTVVGVKDHVVADDSIGTSTRTAGDDGTTRTILTEEEKRRLYYRFSGPTFPRDLDVAAASEKNA